MAVLEVNNLTIRYTRSGPDILKRLREAEKQRHFRLHTLFGIDRQHRTTHKVHPAVLGLALPYTVYRSPYPVERIPFEPETATGRMGSSAGANGQYLLDPINNPVRIGDVEKRLLRRINGRRNLGALLKKQAANPPKRTRYFLMYLLNSGLVDAKGNWME